MAEPVGPILFDGPVKARCRIVLAHGAGAPMDSCFMDRLAAGLAEHGIRSARFEFPYMRARRQHGRRRPPDRQPVLLETWRRVIDIVGAPDRLLIGGKSMGGRMASLVADEAGVAGLVCLGFPFHAPGRPPGRRIEHLAGLATPCLILQGERDPFGRPEEVADYPLADTVMVTWLPDGDHDLTPRKASGYTQADNIARAAAEIAAFADRRYADGA